MRWSSQSSGSAVADMLLPLLLLAAAAPGPAAAMLRCDHVVADGQRFDFSKLKGPHSVVTTQNTPPTQQNTTYTLDLCGPLRRKGDVPKGEECPNGTWACAIRRYRSSVDNKEGIGQVIPIAGNLEDQGGKPLDHVATRLRTSDSHSDSRKEGVRLVLKGGRYPLTGPVSERKDQRAIVELRCDPDREGTEGEWAAEEQYENPAAMSARADEGKEDGDGGDGSSGDGGDKKEGEEPHATGERQLKNEGAALVWETYEEGDEFNTLRLTWYTKYACESVPDDEGGADEPDGDTSRHWGFFTWLVILVFLATAAYLIFGSWLNYNRYGARGWDLLPHGDTIRDIPYLLKDWTRRLINTLQGSGSRGGYSAV